MFALAEARCSPPARSRQATLYPSRTACFVPPQARKLEGELDAKLAAYGKLCTGYDSAFASKRGEAGLANDQVRGQTHTLLLHHLLHAWVCVVGSQNNSCGDGSYSLGHRAVCCAVAVKASCSGTLALQPRSGCC